MGRAAVANSTFVALLLATLLHLVSATAVFATVESNEPSCLSVGLEELTEARATRTSNPRSPLIQLALRKARARDKVLLEQYDQAPPEKRDHAALLREAQHLFALQGIRTGLTTLKDEKRSPALEILPSAEPGSSWMNELAWSMKTKLKTRLYFSPSALEGSVGHFVGLRRELVFNIEQPLLDLPSDTLLHEIHHAWRSFGGERAEVLKTKIILTEKLADQILPYPSMKAYKTYVRTDELSAYAVSLIAAARNSTADDLGTVIADAWLGKVLAKRIQVPLQRLIDAPLEKVSIAVEKTESGLQVNLSMEGLTVSFNYHEKEVHNLAALASLPFKSMSEGPRKKIEEIWRRRAKHLIQVSKDAADRFERIEARLDRQKRLSDEDRDFIRREVGPLRQVLSSEEPATQPAP